MCAASPSIGQVIGHYRILEGIGAGGMGVVYRAQDEQLHRDVALKVLPAGTLADDAARKRFRQEAQALARLNHPNVATVHEFFTHDGVDYLVTEYIPGITLDAKLKQGPLSESEVLQLGTQLAEGLDDAHHQGVVHRDLKPGNLRLTQTGRLKILDFGLAKFIEPEGALAQTGTISRSHAVTGTLPYMAPEQLQGQGADARSDVWAAGAVLYEMATGKRAFPEPYAPLLVDAILHKSPQPPMAVNPRVSSGLASVILKSLSKDPAQRYQSAGELRGDLQRLTAGVTPAAGRRRLIWWAAAIVALVAISGTYFIARQHQPAPHSTATPVKNRHSVAVLGFQNLSGNADNIWLSTALSEMLTTELAAGEQLRTVSGEDVARAKIDLSLSDSDSYAKDTLGRVHKNLGADYVVIGSYLYMGKESGGQIRLDLHLQDAAAGETVASVSETGNEADLLELVSRAGSELRTKLGIAGVTPADIAAVKASLPSNPEAARLYSEGLVKLRLFDALAARSSLERAVTADPDFVLTHSALADAWSTLGYDERAKQEAKKAFDLSAGLSREEKLWVEGRYREITKDWGAAIERYRTLFSFAPDNIDYGLRLVQAQTKAGRTADAKLVLGSLRTLAPPARDDPRIDLADAAIAESVGDFKQEQLAAARATAKGMEQGARLLTARALRTEAWAHVNLGQHPEGTKKAEEARLLYEAAGDRNGVASALNVEGTVFLNQGDLANARRIYNDELAIYRQVGNESGVAFALNNIGAVLLQQGDLAAARKILDETLAVFREVGDRYSEGYTLNNMATAAMSQGKLQDAERFYQHALKIFDQIGEKDGSAYAWVNLGGTYQQLGDLTGAKKYYEQALAATRETGDKTVNADGLFGLGDVALLQGDLSRAQKWYSDSLSVRNEMGDKGAAAESRVGLAEVSIEQERPSDAEAALREARQEFRREKATDDEIASNAVLVRALRVQGKLSDALQETEATRALSTKTQNPAVRLKFAIEAARVRSASGQNVQARRELGTALADASRIGLVIYQLESRLAIAEVELKYGDPTAARARLDALQKEARSKGFGLVARKAASSSK